jgi:hypothetical protein
VERSSPDLTDSMLLIWLGAQLHSQRLIIAFLLDRRE